MPACPIASGPLSQSHQQTPECWKSPLRPTDRAAIVTCPACQAPLRAGFDKGVCLSRVPSRPICPISLPSRCFGRRQRERLWRALRLGEVLTAQPWRWLHPPCPRLVHPPLGENERSFGQHHYPCRRRASRVTPRMQCSCPVLRSATPRASTSLSLRVSLTPQGKYHRDWTEITACRRCRIDPRRAKSPLHARWMKKPEDSRSMIGHIKLRWAMQNVRRPPCETACLFGTSDLVRRPD